VWEEWLHRAWRGCSLRDVTYPRELLGPDEHILLEFRPHWSALWKEVLFTIAYVVILFLLNNNGWNGWVFTILTVVWVWLAVGGYMQWSSTNHVLTDKRFIYRSGLIRKTGYELPLDVIQNVGFRQNIIERSLGVGDLAMETAGTHGQSILRNIPRPEQMKAAISDARHKRSEEINRAAPTPSPSNGGTSAAEQLAILAKLLDEGKLSTDEFETQKQLLLGG
jgi:uncharacterized membrane protein YdbT with pleckstrin-like domain